MTSTYYVGGYPGAASLVRDETRLRQYVRDALIKPNIESDILHMTRVEKNWALEKTFLNWTATSTPAS